jgi:hypothetical protein
MSSTFSNTCSGKTHVRQPTEIPLVMGSLGQLRVSAGIYSSCVSKEPHVVLAIGGWPL